LSIISKIIIQPKRSGLSNSKRVLNLVDVGFLNRDVLANAAIERADLYSFLMKVICDPPNTDILREIRRTYFIEALITTSPLVIALKSGADEVRDYAAKMAGMAGSEILSELGSDRADVLGAFNDAALNFPGGGFVSKNQAKDSIIKITYFPLEENEIKNKKVNDVLDYLCIQLDYMNLLCRRENKKWLEEPGAIQVISQEVDFLRAYLISGIVDCIDRAQQRASTGYYRGFMNILANYIPADLKYLNQLLLSR
jgi:hypothetical protein